MPSVNVIDINGKQVGTLDLDDAVFSVPVNEHLLWETVKWQLAKRRQGTHSTKRRGEVSGSTKKPWRQKGTGRARQGSHRAPQWVGGGSVFGPKPRSYEYTMPRKARRNALKSALSARVAEGKLIVVDAFPAAGGKTKSVVQALERIGAGGGALIVDVSDNDELRRGARNLPDSKWIAPEGLNVYDVLDHEHLVMTQASAKLVEQALR
ncbi:MAG: 50S ribosomal protein L4 [Deltaproteobacteria bacterium]|nr:MAG: 50S ribosomal protein L4 [Deltaproteobacteria bacterium]